LSKLFLFGASRSIFFDDDDNEHGDYAEAAENGKGNRVWGSGFLKKMLEYREITGRFFILYIGRGTEDRGLGTM